MKNTDLHIHTNYSDGIKTPLEIIKIAESKKLKAISITDHDTLDAYQDIPNIKTNLEIITGVEIQASKTEILGYFVDLKHSELNHILDKNRLAKEEYIFKKVDGLKDINIDIEYEEVLDMANPSRIILNTHIAKLLLEKGYIENLQEGFERYLNKIRVKTTLGILDTKKAIKTIISAGGKPVLPHPWYLKPIIQEDLFGFMSKLKNHGLVGMETTGYIPEDKKCFFENIKDVAKDLELIETGGSDFHDLRYYPNNELGKYNINYSILDKLRKA
jgi:predicted metal-dependent phosphoesterase TrpH